jgi:uncharacterized protein (DUF697 family)
LTAKPKLAPRSVIAAVRELREAGDRLPIVVDGASNLVPLLARELRAGGDPAAVREGGSANGAAALVWIGAPDPERLRAASRAKVAIVAVTDLESVPYVLDTDLVRVAAGERLPTAEVAKALARRMGREGAGVAARLPVLRDAVVDELIRSISRQNATIAAAVWVPGVDMPALTLNQARLVLRIAVAHGEAIDGSRLPELLGVVGAGFGFRAIARQLVGLVPVAGWAAQGALAYGGTKAIGEAARLRYSRS